MTKEEKFILELYSQSPDEPINRYQIGRSLGLTDKSTDIITRNLAQANFVKKSGPVDIYITANGVVLAESL